MIGESIGHYRIVEKLGSGGMGDVFLAEDTKLKRHVALKFLPREALLDEDARTRFVHEAQAASALDHANVGTIYQIDEYEGRSFIVMACYTGGSLKDRLEEGPLGIDEFFEIAGQICSGLGKAHDAGIVHRDIKPANIMLTEDGQVKIVDFGLAKLVGATVVTKTGATLGTAAYMSPEQIQGLPVDARTDIWSVGVVLYELLAGKRPFAGEYDQAIVYSILNTDPELLLDQRGDAPAGLEAILEKALAKNPDRRYTSLDELRADLEAVHAPADTAGSGRRSSVGYLSRRKKRLLARVASVAGVIVAGLLAVYLWRARPSEAEPVSIAVMPLSGGLGETDTEWLTDGLTEALITDLAEMRNVRVIARNSVMRYKDSTMDLSEIADELGVTYVLDGSVTQSGDSVTIATRLAEADANAYVWGETYESAFSGLLSTQNRIAGAVLEEIRGELDPGDLSRVQEEREINPRVYEAYLRGMHFINKLTPEGIQKGLEYLRGALDLDPADPFVWTGLANGYITIGHSPYPTPDVWQLARAAAERAVSLDSTMAEARSVHAIVKGYYDWDWAAAEREYRRAKELNPSLSMNHYHYSWLLIMLGRIDEALEEHVIAAELDPLVPPMIAWTAEAYRLAGQLEEAQAQVEKARELGGIGIPMLIQGRIYLTEGRVDEAVAVHEEMAEAAPEWKGFLGTTYARAGRTQDARRIADELINSGPSSMDAIQLAFIYAWLDDADNAFKWAEFEPHHAWLPWLVSDWGPFGRFKDDPRYQRFVERVGLDGILQP